MANTKQSIEDKELWMAAIHEASHAELITSFGGLAVTSVRKNPGEDLYQKAWRGQCKIIREPGSLSKAPKHWRAYVGMAGYIGEQISQGELDTKVISDNLRDALSLEDISNSDADLIGEAWLYRDILNTVRMLTERWDKIEQKAHQISQAARTPIYQHNACAHVDGIHS